MMYVLRVTYRLYIRVVQFVRMHMSIVITLLCNVHYYK